MENVSKLEMLETAEGLMGLLNGFQSMAARRKKKFEGDNYLISELANLIAESEALKRAIARIIDEDKNVPNEVGEIKTKFIKLLNKMNDLYVNYRSRTQTHSYE